MPLIAVSAENDLGLEGTVSAHFGRCPYFTLIEVDGTTVQNVRTIANPYFGNHQPGQIPAFIHEQGADVMLSGGMGSGAVSYFQGYGVAVATGASGTVGDSLASFLRGELSGGACCSEDHHAH
jgi:predicted Fe-Mo cluster-binding NifX family protein